MNLREKIRQHLDEVLRLKTSPLAIATGFTVGTCISVLPTVGFGVFIGVVLTLIFKRLSKIALFAGLAFWNPLTLIPLYSLSFAIGDWLFAGVPPRSFEFEVLNELYSFSRRFLVGNLIITTAAGVISFGAVYAIAIRFQRRAAATESPDRIS